MTSTTCFAKWVGVMSLAAASVLATAGSAEEPKGKRGDSEATDKKPERASAATPGRNSKLRAKKKRERKRGTLRERRAKRRKKQDDRGEKRRQRLTVAAKKMRDRAKELREQAQQGKLPPTSKRPGSVPPTKDNLIRQAEKLEANAVRLDERALSKVAPKVLGAEGGGQNHASRVQATRKARKQFLRRRWGKKLHNKMATKELRTHGRRIAMLKRIRNLAQGAKDFDTAKRATDLLVREQARHRKAMTALPAPQLAQ